MENRKRLTEQNSLTIIYRSRTEQRAARLEKGNRNERGKVNRAVLC